MTLGRYAALMVGRRFKLPIPRAEAQLVDVFIHIPKTGGSCVRTVLEQNYRPSEMVPFNGPVSEWRSFMEGQSGTPMSARLLHGHVPFGVHIPTGRVPRYVTMVREPMSRIISDYLFSMTPESGYSEQVEQNGASFRDFALAFGAEVENVQAKWLAGIHPLARDAISDGELLDRAKASLGSYLVVGLNEMLPETMLLMAVALGWKPPVFRSVNRSPLAARLRQALPAELVEQVKARNSVDFALYGEVSARFKDLVSRQPPLFWKALEEIILANETLDEGRSSLDLKATFVPGRDRQRIAIDPKKLRNAAEFIRMGLSAGQEAR